jgi:thymidylate synthase ThyX
MTDFSNRNRDVFLIQTDMIDRGAMMSRYSRTLNLDIRDVYDREFKNNPERASNFYKRIFLDYGDESVAELTTAQLGIQNISNVLSKVIEEPRIGLSYLEKSSRYVKYNKKVNGNYLFLPGNEAGISGMEEEYNNLCTELFDFYSTAYSVMIKYFEQANPLTSFMFEVGGKNYSYDDLKSADAELLDKSYRSSLRSAVLDEIRSLLPASTLTNMGLSGNGRAFISLIERLNAYGTPESMKYADLIYHELEPELPELIDDAVKEHGKAQVDYIRARNAIGNNIPFNRTRQEKTTLISYMNEDAAIDVASRLLIYQNTGLYGSYPMTPDQELSVIKEIIAMRGNRRHKIGRAFESINYTFEVIMNYGAFREFQRHRFFSIIRKPLSTSYGYDIPENLAKIPELRDRYAELMNKAENTYSRIKEKYGIMLAQYAVPYAYKYPVAFTANLNELTYFIELRSNPQVHPDLRRVAFDLYDQIRKVHPRLASLIKYIDTGEYKLGRLPAEVRKESKKKSLSGNGN